MPVDKSETRVRQMFSQIAPRYDLLNHLLSLNIDKRWRAKAVKLVPPPPGEPRILDVCSGTGDLAFAYWRATGGRAHVTATDFAHPMLVRAAEKARRYGAADRVRFFEADTQRLPLPDERFDIVCVGFGLRNVTDTDRGLAEMTRTCAPGGRVMVLEFSQSRGPLRALYNAYFKHVLPRIGQRLSRNSHDAYSYLPQSVREFPSGEALCERMRAAGLTDVRHWPLTFGIATVYAGTK